MDCAQPDGAALPAHPRTLRSATLIATLLVATADAWAHSPPWHAVVPAVCCAPQVTKTWANPAGGLWLDAANWSPLGVPASLDSVRFTGSLTGPVLGGGGASDLAVEQGDVAINLLGGTLALYGPALNGFLRVGTTTGSAASLHVFNGGGAGGVGIETPLVVIGGPVESSGSLVLSATNLYWGTYYLYVGAKGIGSLRLEDGALAGGAIVHVGVDPGSNGTVTVTGAESVLSANQLIIGRGLLEFSDAGAAYGGSGVWVFPDGLIRGDGHVGTETLVNFGSIEPGSSIGTLFVAGGYKQLDAVPGLGTDSGALIVEATTEGGPFSHDQLAISDGATLGGLLELRPAGEFDPEVGTVIRCLTAASLVDTFDVALLPGLPDRYIRVEYVPGTNGLAGGAEVDLIVEKLGGAVGFGLPALASLDGEPLAVKSGNIDGEQDAPDLVLAIPNGTDPAGANGTVLILFDLHLDSSTGELTYAASLPLNAERLPSALSVADVDANGSDDIIVANAESDSLIVYFSAQGNITAQTTIPVGDMPLAVAAAAFDGVAGLDLVVTNGASDSVSIIGYTGGFGFRHLQTLPTAELPCSVDPIDIDLDGAVDFVATNNGSSTVAIFLNQGEGVFNAGPVLPVGAGPIDVVASDLNGDGSPEIVTSNATDGTVSVIRNQAAQPLSFAPAVQLPVGAAGSLVGSLAILDLGEDAGVAGDKDIVVIGSDADGPNAQRVLRFLRNDSQSSDSGLTFASAATLDTGGNATVITAMNLDADVGIDLLVLNAQDEGVAGAPSSSIAGIAVESGAPVQGDLDGDGGVGQADLAILLGAWGTADGRADLSGDGTVGSADLAILLGAWTV